MSIHNKQHGILVSDDHTPGTAPAAGEVNLIGTDNSPALVETVLEAPGAVSTTSKIVRRSNTGHIAVPGSGQSANEVLTKAQVEAMLTDGIYKPSVHSVVDNHTSAIVGNGTTGGVALVVGDIVINKTDKKLYTVTAGTGTGASVTWDAGVSPVTAQVRLDRTLDVEWIYDAEANVWLDRGSSSHTRAHAMTNVADHTATPHRVFYANASGVVSELALGTANAPLLSKGTAVPPVFGTLCFAETTIVSATAIPSDTDFAAVPVNTIGIVRGSAGGIWAFYKNVTDVYYVELTGI